jgi:hypothetical protein
VLEYVLTILARACRGLKTGFLKVAVLDVVLLVFAYYVLQDLDWRSSFAVSRGFGATTSYSLLTRMFEMVGRGTTLQSPPTLDWIQVVVAILIILNLGYAFGALRGSRREPKPTS